MPYLHYTMQVSLPVQRPHSATGQSYRHCRIRHFGKVMAYTITALVRHGEASMPPHGRRGQIDLVIIMHSRPVPWMALER